jgi:prophage tail gpP-like protein
MTDDVSIVIGSTAWGGWERVSITRGVETVPAFFSLIGTERYPDSGNEVDIKPGSPAVVRIGGDTVITGYAERIMRRLSTEEHSVTLRGRSKLADLVDCSGFTQQWQFNNLTLLSMARIVCQPFGISVSAPDGDSAPIPSWMLVLTETGYEFIEEISRWAQKLPYDDENGNLVLAALGDNAHSSGVAEGQNVQEFESVADVSQVYSTISAIYQDTSILEDGGGTTDIPYLKDPSTGKPIQAVDNHLPPRSDGQARYRPLLIISEQGNGMNNVVPKRVAWEMARRWGRSQEVRVTVDSWRDSGGTLWTPNWLVPVELPSAKLGQATLLITQVTYLRDAEGTRAILTLMPPEAMAPMPSAPFMYSAAWQAASNGTTTGAQTAPTSGS